MAFALPRAEIDGFGATFIPRAVRMHDSSHDLLLVAPTIERLADLKARLDRPDVQVLREMEVELGGAVVIRPSPQLNVLALWTALGLDRARLDDPTLVVSSEREALFEHYSSSLRAIGLKESGVEPRLVGLNLAGSQVYDTLGGRVAIGRDAVVHYEHDLFDDGRRKSDFRDRFLRATNSEELSNCARGAALAQLRGASNDARTIRRLHGDVVGIGEERPELSLFAFQEDIEAWSAVLVAKYAQDRRGAAQAVVANSAAHAERPGGRIQLQQYSTPLPIVTVAQEILRIGAADRVLEPTIGNGALASLAAASGAAIDGWEIDERRRARAERALRESGAREVRIEGGSFTNAEFTADAARYDVALANPPFSALPVHSIVDDYGRSIRVARLDQEIALQALGRVDPASGRAFLVMPGEMVGEGKISGPVKSFDTYLRATYEIAGSAMLDGRLYRKSGAEFPVIVYALGPHLESPLSATDARGVMRDTVPYLATIDELNAWGDAAAAKMDEIFARRVGADFLTSRTLPLEPAPGAATPASPTPVSAAAPAGPVEATAPDVADFIQPSEELLDDFVVEEDPFQIDYEPMSRVGGPRLKIQRALAGPVAGALRELEEERGSIDAFVAEKVGVPEAELGSLLYAGQVDSVGLTLHNAMKGRSVIIGDLMGVGKGRQLAALSRAALAEGRPIIFMTDKPNLFTDFVSRDLATVMNRRPAEIGEIIRPFIMNSDPLAAILDPDFEGERKRGAGVLFKPTPAAKRSGAFSIPATDNMALSTYSQLSAAGREAKSILLSDWIEKHEKGPLLILDEAQKAAGETSAVGDLVSGLIEVVERRGGSVAYASATPLKSARNIRVYRPALPDVGMPADKLVELIEKEPIALQEALSFEMARSGTLISRELDNSDVARDPVSLEEIDPARYQTVLAKVDQFSGHLATLLAMGREIKDWARTREDTLSDIAKRSGAEPDRNGKFGQVGVHVQSPASRFHAIANYVVLAVNNCFMEDLVLRSLAAGRKPLIAIANTGESLLVDLMQQARGATELDEDAALLGETKLPEAPHLGHVLKRVADRLLTVKETSAFGESESRRLDQFEPWLARFCEAVDASDLQMLSLTAIDDITHALEERGLRVGELTGRSFRVSRTEDGGALVGARPRPVTYDVVSAFNGGDLDVLVLNQSAAVGLSAHSSPANGFDVRQREMIKAQMQADVTNERQIDGRINRVGQIHKPVYTIPMQGLAASDRLAQLFNKKNRSLTATSTANRENESNIKETLDLLNEVGQAVCREFLVNNPGIAEQLDIDPESLGESRFAEKLMGRLIATTSQVQREVMSELDAQFQMRVSMLDALGENPLRLREYNWYAHAETVQRLVAGDERADKMSERPLVMKRLTYTEEVRPILATDLLGQIERGRDDLFDEQRSRTVSVGERLAEAFASTLAKGEIDFSDVGFDHIMNRAEGLKSLGATEVDAAKAAEIWSNRAALEKTELKGLERTLVEAGRKAEFLIDLVRMLEPGAVLTPNPALFRSPRETTLYQALTDQLAEVNVSPTPPAVVTRVSFPEDRPLNFGAWDIRVVTPGEERSSDLTLATAYSLMRDERLRALRDPETPANPELEWVLRPAHANDDGIGLFIRGEVGFSAEQRKAVEAAMAGQADVPGAVGVFGNANSPIGRAMAAVTEHVAGGEVTRTRYSVEGNIFGAVAAFAGKRLGEKALYVDEDGEIRHCFMLKKDGHKKVLEQVVSSISERSAFIRADQGVVTSFVEGYQAILRLGDHPERRTQPGEVEIAARQLGRLVAEMSDDPRFGGDVEAAVAAVREDLPAIYNELTMTLRSMKSVNSGMFVGYDPFSLVGRKKSEQNTASCVRVLEGERPEDARLWYTEGTDQIAALTGQMQERGALLCVSPYTATALVKAKNEGAAALVKDWKNSLAGNVRLRHGVVGRSSSDNAAAVEAICAAARDPRFDGMIGVRGGMVAFHEVMRAAVRRLAPEMASAKTAQTQENQVTQVVSETAPLRVAAG